MNKKITSLLLVLAMLMSMLVVPAYAENAVTTNSMTLEAMSFTESDTNPTEGAAADSVKPGDTFMIKVQFNAAEAVELSGYSVKLAYESDAFEVYSYADVGPIAFVAEESGGFPNWYATVNTDKEDVALWNNIKGDYTNLDYKNVAAGESVVLGYLLLKVKAGAENGDYDFSFIVDGEGERNKNYLSDPHANRIGNVELNSAACVTVTGGAVPKLSGVSLDEAEVTVDGEKNVTVQASAVSGKGNDLTNKVTWTVEPADKGVEIDETTGKITVAANAGANGVAVEYTVKASPKDGLCDYPEGVESVTYTLTVKREPAVLCSLAVSGAETIDVAQDGTNVETTYTVAGKDQFGSDYDLADVTWSVTEAEDVSIDAKTGKLTVMPKAAAGSVTVKAAVGELFATKTVVIDKAAPVAKSIVVLRDGKKLTDGIDTVNIPTEGTNVYTYTAVITDQYGEEYKGAVSWNCSAPTGVTFNAATGKLTVSSNAAEDARFELSAKFGDATKVITITVAAFTAPEIDKEETIVDATIKDDSIKDEGKGKVSFELQIANKNEKLTYQIWVNDVAKPEGGYLATVDKTESNRYIVEDTAKEIVVFIEGNMNDDVIVDIRDVRALLLQSNSYATKPQPVGFKKVLEDMNGDDYVDIRDVRTLLLLSNDLAV